MWNVTEKLRKMNKATVQFCILMAYKNAITYRKETHYQPGIAIERILILACGAAVIFCSLN